MQKSSTVRKTAKKIFKGRQLTIGMDLGAKRPPRSGYVLTAKSSIWVLGRELSDSRLHRTWP